MTTYNAAKFIGEEKMLGSIERGKYAALVVFNGDYFTSPEREIRKIQPLRIMVGGKIVYQADNFCVVQKGSVRQIGGRELDVCCPPFCRG